MSPPNLRTERLKELLEVHGVEALLVDSPENRRYLSGFTGSSGMVLVATTGQWLLTDFRYVEQAGEEASGFSVVRHGRMRYREVAALARSQGLRLIGFESHKVSVEQFQEMEAASAEVQWIPASGLVEQLRLVKSAEELAVMQKAARIADQALQQVLDEPLIGQSEEQIALRLEWAMRRLGAEGLAFPTIVAAGAHGSLPHAKPGSRCLSAGDLVTIDFGARFQGYHSDETVTLGLSGDGPHRSRLEQIYAIVREAQNAGIARVKPGIAASAVDEASRAVIVAAGYGEYFGHGTGHGVGLEVHEAPWASAEPRVDYVLEPGMVITVEPGIYLPGIGGVRLEDTLQVTAQGCERLTGADKGWRQWE